MPHCIEKWESPYQTLAYANALAASDFTVSERTAPGGQAVYFYGDRPEQVAWEVGPHIEVEGLGISEDQYVYRPAQLVDEPSPDDYYTRALSAAEVGFSNRFMRNVQRAHRAYPAVALESAVTRRQQSELVAAFDPYPERRDDISPDRFGNAVSSLIGAGAMEAYAMKSPRSKELLGAMCVLRSDTQANLRYYTAQRAECAGHLLHYLTIDRLLGNGAEIVDLSGISPHSDDPQLKGIDTFKGQIRSEVVRFQRFGHGDVSRSQMAKPISEDA